MAMHLSELKIKPVTELIDTAREMGLENVGRSRKQEVIAAIVRKLAKNGEDIYGEGTLEILQDGFGFLRSADSSYPSVSGNNPLGDCLTSGGFLCM